MQKWWLIQLCKQSILQCGLRQKISNEINTLQTGIFCLQFFHTDVELDEFLPFQCWNFTNLHSFIFNSVSLNNNGVTLNNEGDRSLLEI